MARPRTAHRAPTFFGVIAGIGPCWEHAGFVGFAAGDAMCLDLGADHACDYEEVVLAEAEGELADGEYIEFTPAGPEYHLDEDTFYDGTSTEHTQTDPLQCAGWCGR